MENFKCYYDDTFIGTVVIYGKAQWDKKYVYKRIYYNENSNEYFTRFDGEVFSLCKIDNLYNKEPFYELFRHIRRFTKGCIAKRKE